MAKINWVDTAAGAKYTISAKDFYNSTVRALDPDEPTDPQMDDYEDIPAEKEVKKPKFSYPKDRKEELYLDYFKNNNLQSLFKVMLKSGILGTRNFIFTNVYQFHDDTHTVDRITKSNYNCGNIVVAIDADLESEKILSEHRNTLGGRKIIDDLATILTTVYSAPLHEKIIIDIDTQEVLIEIIQEFKSKGVKVDDQLSLLNINFKELRQKGKSIVLVYCSYLGEALLLPNFNILMKPRFYSYLSHVPKVNLEETPKDKSKVEMITIKDREFPRKLIEGMIESDFDTFYSNLTLESVLHDDSNEDKKEIDLSKII